MAEMIYTAKEAGAYGAKLSGAGMGDCMITFAPPSKVSTVKKAISQAGGSIVNVKANAPDVIRLLPSATVSVEADAGAVIVTLFIVVAVATPNIGVTNVGVVANTATPVPVGSVNDAKS